MFKKLCAWGYRFAILLIVVYGIYCYMAAGWNNMFHKVAFYLLVIMMFTTFSAHADLLEKIRQGEMVNIRARALDFIHWLMLTFMLVGRWDIGGITIWAFLLNIVLLSIIGWQVGIGVGQQWFPKKREKQLGIAMLMVAVLLGLIAGRVRFLDHSLFGWGWMLEVSTAIIATLIVAWWIANDISVIKRKASGYPRSFFIKGIFSNALAIWILIHLVSSGSAERSWILNAGFAFNAIVGNVIFLLCYLAWEYYYARQRAKDAE